MRRFFRINYDARYRQEVDARLMDSMPSEYGDICTFHRVIFTPWPR